MTLLNRFVSFVQEHKLIRSEDHLLIAVSGGVDSIVLCELCHRAGYQFSIAHCNFQLRDIESEADAAFVQNLAKKYNASIWYRKFETTVRAQEMKSSIQETARTLRYSWFREILKGNREGYLAGKHTSNPNCIVTAHHLDDNIETSVMHFFRGTGLSGLRGMKPCVDQLIRPLLFAEKQELIQFAKEELLTWREDQSNQSDAYTRNYFRNNILPSIREVYPGVEQNLASNLVRFSEAEQLYLQAVALHKKKLLETVGGELQIPILLLKKVIPLRTVLYEIIKEFGFSSSQTDEVIRLFDAANGSFIRSGSHRIIKNRNRLIIVPHTTIQQAFQPVEINDHTVQCISQVFHFDRLPVSEHMFHEPNPLVAYLDADLITYPLLIRRWQKGDYFYPLGLRKKKKLARFFIDSKLSATQKEQVLLVESNKKIIWISGYRIDDRFKLTDQTKTVLKIEMRVQ